MGKQAILNYLKEQEPNVAITYLEQKADHYMALATQEDPVPPEAEELSLPEPDTETDAEEGPDPE